MAPSIAVGSILAETYLVTSQIGAGGAGIVFLAEDIALKRKVAIKLLHLSYADSTSMQRFEREAKALNQLRHPNIVSVFRFGFLDDESPYLVMEYAEGESLRSLLEKTGPLICHEAIAIAAQIASALEFAHSQQVIHRDLKPENIMVQPNTQGLNVKILDFGLCKDLSSENEQSATLTKTGTLLGSILYMSPEQCLGKACDLRSDIYSFGCVLYEMITGSAPFVSDLPASIMLMHLNDDLPNILELSPDSGLPLELQELISKCTAKKKAERFQNFSEIRSELDLLKERNISARFNPAKKKSKALGLDALVSRVPKSVSSRMPSILLLVFACIFSLLAVTDWGNALIAEQLQSSLSPETSNGALCAMLQVLTKLGRRSSAESLALETTNSSRFYQWSALDREKLLENYIDIFQKDKRKDCVFALQLRLLSDALDSVAQELKHTKKPAKQIAKPLLNVSRDLYNAELSKKQYTAIVQICERKRYDFPRTSEAPSSLLWTLALRAKSRASCDLALGENAKVELSKYYVYAIRKACDCDNSDLLFSLSQKALELTKQCGFKRDEYFIRSCLCIYYFNQGQIETARQELARLEIPARNLLLSESEQNALRELRSRCRATSVKGKLSTF